METAVNSKAAPIRRPGRNTLKMLKKTWVLYLFLLPSIVYLIIFNYIPLYGIQIAFKDYRVAFGIFGSSWVGFKHFITFFESYQFLSLLQNTLVLSAYALIAGFPVPIVLALLLNYVTSSKFKKISQMVTYAPHFISMVVYCGMIIIFLSNEGVVNQLFRLAGINGVEFLAKPHYFRHIYVWSGVIKNMGWSSIIYISVLTAVPPELHEAAIVDGATKFQRIRYIDIPSILPTAVILLIMNAGQIMNVGFEKAFLLQNSINLEYSEIISTYVYKMGIQSGQFSYSSAIGLFNNIINFVLIVAVNKISKTLTEVSLW